MNFSQLVTAFSYRFLRPAGFEFQGRQYLYFDNPYNTTRLNERAVEVPLIMRYVQEAEGKSILEIGNVLSHYYSFPHDVVDKYEKTPGVINQDALTYSPKKKYDLIISISTIEHIGWDEFPRKANKIPKTLQHLKTLLKKDGQIVFTVPVATNDYLDKMLHDHSLPLTDMRCLKRMTANNQWVEKSWEQIRYCLYDTPFQNANGLVVGTIKKSTP